MLIKQKTLKGIVEGRITLAFRRWKRPTVKSGGSLRTSIGVLAIEAVDAVDEKRITNVQAKRAGYSSREELLAELPVSTWTGPRASTRPSTSVCMPWRKLRKRL